MVSGVDILNFFVLGGDLFQSQKTEKKPNQTLTL